MALLPLALVGCTPESSERPLTVTAPGASELRASFDDGEVVVAAPWPGAPEVGVSLVGWGAEGELEQVDAVWPSRVGARHMYVHDGVSEWWERGPKGLEQGFVVDEIPLEGPLVLELALRGAEALVDADGRSATFLPEPGGRLRYEGLVAWDADGTDLPAWMEATDLGLRLVVDTEGAVGPITVDPVFPEATWSAEGNQAGAWFGSSVASAGDVNGDGFGDVVIGAYRYDHGQTDEGAAVLYLGSAMGLSATPAWAAEGDQAGARFGSMSSAGDVNGDGYADVVVSGGAAGRVYLGSAAGLSATSAWTSPLAGRVASAGDVNGDGYADVVVGNPLYDNGHTNEGAASVYLGSAAGLGLVAAWTVEGGATSGQLGYSVASAGDVNGDGYGDVVLGARDDVSVHLGSAAGLSAAPAWTAPHFSWFRSVASAGDVNGDGYDDLVVGNSEDCGAVVYIGSAAGLSAVPDVILQGSYDSGFGSSVGSAGDVNADGYGDLVVGAPPDNYDDGGAQLFLGSAGGLSREPDVVVWVGQAQDQFGADVGSAGDVNGDGYGDLVVGAYAYDAGQTDEGAALVYLGSAVGLSATPGWTAEGDGQFGLSVASAGDVDADGYGDVVVGELSYYDGQAYLGAAFVYRGSASGLATTPAWTLYGDQSSASFGWVASADVNGDGYGDVVVGASRYDDGQYDEGAAFVYLGSAVGLSATPAWTAEGDQAGAGFGWPVASAGDVNGDGYGDVVVGAYAYDDGQADEGAAFLYLGSASGLASAPAWLGASDQSSSWYGSSVASAGDVDGDGRSDLLVGAPQHENGQYHEGAAFLYLGRTP